MLTFLDRRKQGKRDLFLKFGERLIDPDLHGAPTTISKSIRGTLGSVNNARPLTIGGKLDCNGTSVTCDYFPGTVDWVTIERS